MATMFQNDYLRAHRDWLRGFIDDKINLSKKMCDKTNAELPRDLLPLTEYKRKS